MPPARLATTTGRRPSLVAAMWRSARGVGLSSQCWKPNAPKVAAQAASAQ